FQCINLIDIKKVCGRTQHFH
ncbi:hypothetical protein AZE42_12076, partial [Rhizopogon vesiculosus]